MEPAVAAEAEAATSDGRRASLTDRIERVVFRGALASFGALPLRPSLRLATALGSLFYVFDRPHRRIALKNLGFAFPDQSPDEHRRILRATCCNLARMAFEVAHLPALTRATLPRYVRPDDPERFERMLAKAHQKGAVILTAHFGNWELFAYACGLLGHPVTLIHRPMRNPLVDRDIDGLRAGAGTQALAKKAAAKEALRRLKAGALVVVPADQNQTQRFGVFVDFFGVPACTTAGPARLAMLTGVPIIPAFLVREGESERHRIVVLPEVEPVATGDRAADILATTQRCTAIIEDMIRRHPDHWIWFHKRWNTRRLGESRIY